MPTNSTGKKLGLKPGHRVLLVGASRDVSDALSAGMPDVTFAVRGKGPFDAVLLFATELSVARLAAGKAMGNVAEGGLLWVCYPKGGSEVQTDIKRDLLWDLLEEEAWRPVAQVAVDEIWSAVRFRPLADVKVKSKPRPAPKAPAKAKAKAPARAPKAKAQAKAKPKAKVAKAR